MAQNPHFKIMVINLLVVVASYAAVLTVAPGSSIQTAVNAALNSDTIKVAAGTYQENVIISNKSVALLGGYTNTDGFSIRNPVQNVTTIHAAQTDLAVITLDVAGNAIVDGFTVTGGLRGIADITWPYSSGVVISNNIIERNIYRTTGRICAGGVYVRGNNVKILNNIIRHNVGGFGGGLCADGENILIEGNLFENDTAWSDHAAACYLIGTITFRNNIIRNCLVGGGMTYGCGGAVLIDQPNTVCYVSNCIASGNVANGGIGSDGGATVYIDHCLMYNGGTNPYGGEINNGIYLSSGDPDAGSVNVSHCTIFGQSGHAVRVEKGSVSLTNCILFIANGKTPFLDLNPNTDPEVGSVINVRYSILDSIWPGTGNIVADPLFADTANHDFHVKSMFGRWDSVNRIWVNDIVTSPAIDAGDPGSSYENEIDQNGNRVNVGYYGNTSEASKSSFTSEVKPKLIVNEHLVLRHRALLNSPKIEIEFNVPEKSAPVRLIIKSLTGRKIATLVNRILSAGNQKVVWDVGGLATGDYLCILKIRGKSAAQIVNVK